MASHGKNSAAYYRARRAMQREQRAQSGYPLRGYGFYDSLPHIVAQGQELKTMMELPMLQWPLDLFDQAVSIERLMADGDYATSKIGRVVKTDHLCACGCGHAHNNAVSRVVGSDSPYGYSRKVVWYRSLTCRNKHMGVNP